MGLLQQPRERAGERLRLLVVRRPVQRHVDLQALRARRLDEGGQAERIERLSQEQRHARAVDHVGRCARIEVEHHGRGLLDVGRPRQEHVQLQAGQVGQPHERRAVLDEAEVDVARVAAALAEAPDALRPDRGGGDPVGAVVGALLLVEPLRAGPVGKAVQRQRPVGEVRKHHRRDPRVVVDHLRLGEAGLRVEDLVEVGQLELAPVDLDRDAGGGHRLATSWRRSPSRRPTWRSRTLPSGRCRTSSCRSRWTRPSPERACAPACGRPCRPPPRPSPP